MGGNGKGNGRHGGAPVRCPNCGERLATDYGDRLDLGPIIIRRATTLECPRCRRELAWDVRRDRAAK
jgi:predicted RNA-binding Zn-ribbon protein involved in translation (DUF1610 family)